MTFDPSQFGWPQWTMLVLMFLALAINASQHGKPKTGEYNGFVSLISFALSMFILVCGGFFA